jgi:hypothetical protein
VDAGGRDEACCDGLHEFLPASVIDLQILTDCALKKCFLFRFVGDYSQANLQIVASCRFFPLSSEP